jgi:hypothetical protein
MSSAKPPQGKEPASLQSTRQMLDELDALMERMLALPVNDLEDAVAPPRDIVHMPTVSATLTVLESPVEAEEAPAPKEPPAPPREKFPSYITDLGAAPKTDLPELSPFDANAIPEEVIPPSIMTLPATRALPPPPVTPLRLPRRSLASLCLQPLLWFNRGFDRGATLLGWPGQWLRGPRGRNFLGLTGVALLVAAGLWLVKDWLGWIW